MRHQDLNTKQIEECREWIVQLLEMKKSGVKITIPSAHVGDIVTGKRRPGRLLYDKIFALHQLEKMKWLG